MYITRAFRTNGSYGSSDRNCGLLKTCLLQNVSRPTLRGFCAKRVLSYSFKFIKGMIFGRQLLHYDVGFIGVTVVMVKAVPKPKVWLVEMCTDLGAQCVHDARDISLSCTWQLRVLKPTMTLSCRLGRLHKSSAQMAEATW